MSDMPVNAGQELLQLDIQLGVAAKKQGYGCHCEYHVCPSRVGGPDRVCFGCCRACYRLPREELAPDATDQDRPVYKCQCQHVDCKQEVVAPGRVCDRCHANCYGLAPGAPIDLPSVTPAIDREGLYTAAVDRRGCHAGVTDALPSYRCTCHYHDCTRLLKGPGRVCDQCYYSCYGVPREDGAEQI